MRFFIFTAMLLALFAAFSPAAAQSLDDITVLRHPRDRIAFSWPGMPANRISSARLLIDFDGPEQGEPTTGFDWMVDGGSIFAFTPTATGWSWDRIGQAVISYHKGDTLMVLIEAPPSRQGSYIIAEHDLAVKSPEKLAVLNRTSFSLDEAAPWPSDFAPASYPLEEWMESVPPALTVHIGRYIADTEWKVPDNSWKPELIIHDTTNIFPFVIELMNPLRGSAVTLSNGIFSTDGKHIRWSGETDGITWNFLFKSNDVGDVEITGHLNGATDISLQVRIGFQMDLNGWTWHDNLTRRRIITSPGPTCSYTADLPLGESEISQLPLGVIHHHHTMLMMANDPNEPRAFRSEANPTRSFFGLIYNLTLTQSTTKFPGQSSFRCIARGATIQRAEIAMRQAFTSYYDAYPEVYLNRTGRAAGWIPFTDVSTIEHAEDFGDMFDVREKTSDQTTHMSFRYAEPCYYWLTLSPGTPWTEAAAWDRLVLLATSGKSFSHEQAASAIAGLAHQSNHYPKPVFLDVPWNYGARYEVSADPDTPVFEVGSVNRAMVEARLLDEQKLGAGGGGVFLDSMGELHARDFHPNALAAADFPALFDPSVHAPFISGSLAACEWLRVLHHRMQQNNRYVFASGVTRSGPIFSAFVDGFTEEIHLKDENIHDFLTGTHAQNIRLLAGAKPVSLGLLGDFDSADEQTLESIFRQCLLYGFIPGFHSLDGYHQIYWQNPRWYNRDRPLFQKYMPMIQRLAQAGWRPVSTATSIQSDISVEEFGPDTARLFTVHNRNGNPVNAQIELQVLASDSIIIYPLNGEMEFKSKDDTSPLQRWLSGDKVDVIIVVPVEHLETELNMLRNQNSSRPAQLACRSNMESFIREREIKLDVRMEISTPVIKDTETQIRLTFSNHNETTMKISGITATGSAKFRKTEQHEFLIGPGESRTSFIQMKSADLKNDPFIRADWTARTDGQSFNGSRTMKPPYVPACVVSIFPETILSVDPVAGIDVMIQNNSASAHEYVITAKGEAFPAPDVTSFTVEAGTTRHHTVIVSGEEILRHNVDLTVTEGGRNVLRRKINAEFLPAGSSLIRDSRVEISTSGTAPGFDTKFLRDGETYVSGRLPQENSWKSIGRMGSHYIFARFPQPVFVSEIKLHWAADATQPHPASEIIIRARMENGQVETIGTIHSRSNDSFSAIMMSPIKVTELILIQPPLSGPAINPMAMWLTEIEVF